MKAMAVVALMFGLAVGVSNAEDGPLVSVRETSREIRVEGAPVTLDVAWCFCAEAACPEYADWHADFVITFDRDVAKGGISLYGTIGDWQKFQDMEYKGPVCLLKSIGLGGYVDYATVVAMREFRCGAKLEDASLFGMRATMSLQLTNPDDEASCVTLATCNIVFETPDQPNWFDSCISRYGIWPEDAKLATGGHWTADSLADVASVTTEGRLEIGTADAMLGFEADEPKTLGENAGAVSIVSRASFETYSADNLPAVDPNWKGGVILVREKGELRYYGLVKAGMRNEWRALEGPETVADEDGVEIKMTFKPAGFSTLVVYNIGGCDFTHDGMVEIPVVADQRISRVLSSGSGIIHSLHGLTQKAKRGGMLILR